MPSSGCQPERGQSCEESGCVPYDQVGDATPAGRDTRKLYFWDVARLVLWLSREGKNWSLSNMALHTQGC